MTDIKDDISNKQSAQPAAKPTLVPASPAVITPNGTLSAPKDAVAPPSPLAPTTAIPEAPPAAPPAIAVKSALPSASDAKPVVQASKPVVKPVVAAIPEASVQLTREQRIGKLLKERFLRVTAMTDAFFSHRGHCEKCGWQTLQHSEAAAHDLVSNHIWQHWRDVAAAAEAVDADTKDAA